MNGPQTMSEERRPRVPAPPAHPATAADTPREGTPAFNDTPVDGSPALNDTDEIEVLFEKDTVPPVGPSPDHASEYVPPRPLPKPADHKTLEIVPVQISPEAEADPRSAMTQKAMHVLKREDAQRQLMLMGIDATAATPDARVSEVSISDAEGSGKSRAGLYIGGAMVMLIVLALGFIAVSMVNGDPDARDVASAKPSAGPAPAPVPTRTPEATARPTAPAPPTSALPEPPAEPAPKGTTKRKPRPKPGEPKPINE